MTHSIISLFLLIVAMSAVHPAAVRENIDAEKYRDGRAVTVTNTVTITASTPTTTVLSTKLVCAILVNPVATTVCRSKKQYWGVPVYSFGQNEIHQFEADAVFPTQVLGVQPSMMPEFRNQQSVPSNPSISQFNYPFGIQSSMEGTGNGVEPVPTMFRVADPFFFAPLSSLISSIVSNLLTPPVTVTSTQTVFTNTMTLTSLTATATYTLTSVPCLPAQVNICPADPITVPTTAATTAATTTAASTTTAVTTTAATTPTTTATTVATTAAATTTDTTSTTTTSTTPTTPATTTPITTAVTTTTPTTNAPTTVTSTTAAATTTATTSTTSAATTAAATTPTTTAETTAAVTTTAPTTPTTTTATTPTTPATTAATTASARYFMKFFG